ARGRQARRQGNARAARHDLPDLCRDRHVANRDRGGRRMSENRRASPPTRGPMGMGMGPPQKPKNFRTSLRRLLGLLGPQRHLITIVVGLAIASVSLSVAGPKLLGRATDIVFGGFLASHPDLDPGLAAAHGARPGEGIDFTALAQVLVLVLCLYIGASLLM